MFRRPTTPGRWMPATATSCGITSGEPRAARTSAIAAWACGVTGCIWRRPTITWSASTPAPARSAGTKRSPISISSISPPWRPIVVGNHILIGTGNDLDEPGVLQARDPETGDVQWTFYTVPMKTGDPGSNLGQPGCGATRRRAMSGFPARTIRKRISTSSAPAIRSPAYTSPSRGEGDNLYTCSIVAINVDTGKMAWYYQTSPHDTHDWDSAANSRPGGWRFQRQACARWCCRPAATAITSPSIA